MIVAVWSQLAMFLLVVVTAKADLGAILVGIYAQCRNTAIAIEVVVTRHRPTRDDMKAKKAFQEN